MDFYNNCSGIKNDLYMFDPSSLEWTLMSGDVEGSYPPARCAFGFASAVGKLFAFSGVGMQGMTYPSCNCSCTIFGQFTR
jgi:hypothetical protein